mmetsp:Transcript_26537/g.72038  ORF Transcript_26537/g.72038 Transcript_26537/m.72038 type:complete len:292 (-) Transcript_26537:339-1214(-)
MSLRSPRKLAVVGIHENHMGTKAQTLSPRDAAGTGVMAPECTSKLESGVIEARVVVPEKISKLAAEAAHRGVPQEALESPGVAVLAAVGVVARCAHEQSSWGGGSKGSSKTSGSGASGSAAREKSIGRGSACPPPRIGSPKQSRSRSRCSLVLRKAAFSALSSASSRSKSSPAGDASRALLHLEEVLQVLWSSGAGPARGFTGVATSAAAGVASAGTACTGGTASTGYLRTKSLWLLETTSSIFGCSTLSTSVTFEPEDPRHSTRWSRHCRTACTKCFIFFIFTKTPSSLK